MLSIRTLLVISLWAFSSVVFSSDSQSYLAMRSESILSEAAKARFQLSQITEVQENGFLVYSATRTEALTKPTVPSVDVAAIDEILEHQSRSLLTLANNVRAEICAAVVGTHEDVDLDALASTLEHLKLAEANIHIETYALVSELIDKTTKQIVSDSFSDTNFQLGEVDVRHLISINPKGLIASMKGRCAAPLPGNSLWGTELTVVNSTTEDRR